MSYNLNILTADVSFSFLKKKKKKKKTFVEAENFIGKIFLQIKINFMVI